MIVVHVDAHDDVWCDIKYVFLLAILNVQKRRYEIYRYKYKNRSVMDEAVAVVPTTSKMF